jgi:hypothetical protein
MKEQIPTAEDSPLVSEFLSRIASVQEEAKWECRECGLKVVRSFVMAVRTADAV